MSDRPREIWCDTGLYWDYVEDWSEGSWRNNDDWDGEKYVRADYVAELEAKLTKSEALLAKAGEALEGIITDNTWGLEHKAYMECRKALAELTKERSDEKGEKE
jgi:hypothetical protein